MTGFWNLLKSGLELVLRALDRAGMRGARWEWRKRTWRAALEGHAAEAEARRHGAVRRARICRACRTLVSPGAPTCHECGASIMPSAAISAASFLERITPSFGSVTIALVSANTLLLVVILFVWGFDPQARGILSILSPSTRALYAFGMKWGPSIQGGEIWRLVTAIYLHGGLVHLAMNSMALINLGPLIESSFGSRKFFLIYTTTGIAGFIASTLISPDSASVGASGAIFGLLGFTIVYGRYRAGSAGRVVAEQLMPWVVFGVVMLFMPRIDNAAHAGGLLTGALLALVVDAGEPRTREGELMLRLLTSAAVVVTIASFAAMVLTYAERVQGMSGS